MNRDSADESDDGDIGAINQLSKAAREEILSCWRRRMGLCEIARLTGVNIALLNRYLKAVEKREAKKGAEQL